MKNKMKSAIGVVLYAIGMGIMLSYIVLLNLIEVNPFSIIFLFDNFSRFNFGNIWIGTQKEIKRT